MNGTNFMLMYVKKKAFIPYNSISSNLLKSNIALRGHPAAVTGSLHQSNKQLATTEFVNIYKYIMKFEHIDASVYRINNQTNLIVENLCNLFLPTNIFEGTTITIVNSSGTQITINSAPNDIMYASFYLPFSGGTFLTLDANKTAYFTYIINNTLHLKTWQVSIY